MIKKCAECPKEFETNIKSQICCSKECGRLRNIRQKKEWYTKIYKPQITEYKNGEPRPFTKDTVFLVNKWHHEGMAKETIADIMNRPLSDINKALGVEV